MPMCMYVCMLGFACIFKYMYINDHGQMSLEIICESYAVKCQWLHSFTELQDKIQGHCVGKGQNWWQLGWLWHGSRLSSIISAEAVYRSSTSSFISSVMRLCCHSCHKNFVKRNCPIEKNQPALQTLLISPPDLYFCVRHNVTHQTNQVTIS